MVAEFQTIKGVGPYTAAIIVSHAVRVMFVLVTVSQCADGSVNSLLATCLVDLGA